MNEEQKNTDIEIWREQPDNYYSDSIHVTENGGIGINCGGYVIVRPIREWHRLAKIKHCDHDWILIEGNPAVFNTDICTKCHSVKPHTVI